MPPLAQFSPLASLRILSLLQFPTIPPAPSSSHLIPLFSPQQGRYSIRFLPQENSSEAAKVRTCLSSSLDREQIASRFTFTCDPRPMGQESIFLESTNWTPLKRSVALEKVQEKSRWRGRSVPANRHPSPQLRRSSRNSISILLIPLCLSAPAPKFAHNPSSSSQANKTGPQGQCSEQPRR